MDNQVERVTKYGPPRIVIPQEVQESMDWTYKTGQAIVIDAQDNDDAHGLENLLRKYAERLGKSARIKRLDEDHLQFFMTDKRVYRKPTAEREK